MSDHAKWRQAKNAFLLRCRHALSRQSRRYFDVGVRIASGGRMYTFDLATPERDIVAQCRAFNSRFALSAGMTRLREAARYLDGIHQDVIRLLIVGRDPQVEDEETLAQRFVRLNRHLLQRILVLELTKKGGIVCIHGDSANGNFLNSAAG